MAPKTATITIAPEVLVWARESRGLSRVDLSRKMKVETAVVEKWEQSDSETEFTVFQLEGLARHVKRPMAALLLNQPPPVSPMPRDFRRPGNRANNHSPELRLAARRAHRLQRLAAELFPASGRSTAADVPDLTWWDFGPENAAGEIRKLLNVPEDFHTRWRDSSLAFREWRSIIEDLNILVFSSDLNRDEAQGFSISNSLPWVIVVSAKDSPAARCFTLWHEFGHLLHRNGGICSSHDDPDEHIGPHWSTEDWCNRFAEAVLVNGELLNQRPEIEAILSRQSGYESSLSRLAVHFRVSQQVTLYRMRHLGLLSQDRFQSEFKRVMEQQARTIRTPRSSETSQMRRNIAREVVSERGAGFTRAILQALDRGAIDRSDVPEYFGARLKHLENIRREAHR